jgi:hypothetical protein
MLNVHKSYLELYIEPKFILSLTFEGLFADVLRKKGLILFISNLTSFIIIIIIIIIIIHKIKTKLGSAHAPGPLHLNSRTKIHFIIDF